MSVWQTNKRKKKRQKQHKKASNIHMWIAHYTNTKQPESCILSLSCPKKKNYNKPRKSFRLLTSHPNETKQQTLSSLEAKLWFCERKEKKSFFFLSSLPSCTSRNSWNFISATKRVRKRREKMSPKIIRFEKENFFSERFTAIDHQNWWQTKNLKSSKRVPSTHTNKTKKFFLM